MLYFLITFAIMAVSILLIYRAAGFLGLQVERWALILCAVMAVGVNFAAIYLSNLLILDHLMVVVVLVLISAALVTLFNEYLLRRHAPVLAGEEGRLSEDALFEEEENGVVAEGDSAALLPVAFAEAVCLAGGGQDIVRSSARKKARRHKRKTSSREAAAKLLAGGRAAIGGLTAEESAMTPSARGKGDERTDPSGKTAALLPPTEETAKGSPPVIEEASALKSSVAPKEESRIAPAVSVVDSPESEAGRLSDGRPVVGAEDSLGIPQRDKESLPGVEPVSPGLSGQSSSSKASTAAFPVPPHDDDLVSAAASAAAEERLAAEERTLAEPIRSEAAAAEDAPSEPLLAHVAALPPATDSFRSVRPAGKNRGPKGQYGGKRRPPVKGKTGAGALGTGKMAAPKWTPSADTVSTAEGKQRVPFKTPPIGLELARLRTLDDYLDYAFKKRAEGCVSGAILAYHQALGKFRSDPYAPFIVMELGNIYKESGDYAEAVSAYHSALRLAAVKEQSGMAEEFQKNIAYLDTVLHILTRHRIPNTPFSQIPPDYRREIENAFAVRWSEKYQRTGGTSK